VFRSSKSHRACAPCAQPRWKAVAAAILGGVIGKLTIGFAAFLAVRRSVFAGVLAGEIDLVGGTLLFGLGRLEVLPP
jgi:hypothetical protein